MDKVVWQEECNEGSQQRTALSRTAREATLREDFLTGPSRGAIVVLPPGVHSSSLDSSWKESSAAPAALAIPPGPLASLSAISSSERSPSEFNPEMVWRHTV